MLAEIAFLELSPSVLRPALEPFPVPIRTPDALRLAPAEYPQRQGQRLQSASYDERLLNCARRLGIEVWLL